jgi:hypothetical protein
VGGVSVSGKEGAIRLPAEKRAILLSWGAKHKANLAEHRHHSNAIRRLRAQRRALGTAKAMARRLAISTRTVSNYLLVIKLPE